MLVKESPVGMTDDVIEILIRIIKNKKCIKIFNFEIITGIFCI
jgi:hypothetical protein